MPNRTRSRARKPGAAPQPHARDNCPATPAAGGSPCPPPPHRPRTGGRPSPSGALRCPRDLGHRRLQGRVGAAGRPERSAPSDTPGGNWDFCASLDSPATYSRKPHFASIRGPPVDWASRASRCYALDVAAPRTARPPGGFQRQNISHEPFALLRSLVQQRLWAICGSAFQADDAGSIPAARSTLSLIRFIWLV
ncbi:MAG: hypothetical protein RLZZ624_417 [Cyanobacteriota bacterium]